ncbi:MAG: hypothetical protein KF831_01205 [Acidobacteria bacterium]|nr:hypothetical protein [Acidobacteriota bacterium]
MDLASDLKILIDLGRDLNDLALLFRKTSMNETKFDDNGDGTPHFGRVPFHTREYCLRRPRTAKN